jgi:mannose-6-phosphate isomerase-like protein (cupin superfamily)
MSEHVRQTEPFRWEGIEVKPYKSEGTHFAGITRQVLFAGGDGLECELRYFEVAPGGWSSLERHRHAHAIMVVRGSARVLVGDRLIEARAHDLVRIPPRTWHQFQPTGREPLGFLCMVDCERDTPERPDPADLAALRANPVVAAFIRV